MKILALELSSGQGSIAWRDGDQTCLSSEFANDRKHSGFFFENLQRCFEQFGKPERIVVGLGPGSYAGTRIAIAAAIGLQAATNVELVGLPSFLAMPSAEIAYAVIGDARRQSFWYAQVQARQCLEYPTLCTSVELAARIDALGCPIFSAEILPQFPRAIQMNPSAEILAELGRANSEQLVRPPLEPIYLREPHITQPKVAA